MKLMLMSADCWADGDVKNLVMSMVLCCAGFYGSSLIAAVDITRLCQRSALADSMELLHNFHGKKRFVLQQILSDVKIQNYESRDSNLKKLIRICDVNMSCAIYVGWLLAAHPHPEVQRLGWLYSTALARLRETQDYNLLVTEPDLVRYLNDRYSTVNSQQKMKDFAVLGESQYQERIHGLIANMTGSKNYLKLNLAAQYSSLLCLEAGSNKANCIRAYNQSFLEMSPANIAGQDIKPRVFAPSIIMSLPNVIQRIYTHKEYAVLLNYYNRQLLTKIRLAESKSQNTRYGDFFNDLVQSAIDSKSTSDFQVARQMAWDLVGFYGSRGNSTYLFSLYMGEITHPVSVELMQMIASISYLDAITFYSVGGYILPWEARSSCFMGRPYHFWMSAYLTHQQLEQSPTIEAWKGVYMTSVFYNFTSMTIYRHRELILTEPFSDYTNSIRVSLAHSLAGSLWASKKWHNQSIRACPHLNL